MQKHEVTNVHSQDPAERKGSPSQPNGKNIGGYLRHSWQQKCQVRPQSGWADEDTLVMSITEPDLKLQSTFCILCNIIDGRSKKGTSNFKLRSYRPLPEQPNTEELVDFS